VQAGDRAPLVRHRGEAASWRSSCRPVQDVAVTARGRTGSSSRSIAAVDVAVPGDGDRLADPRAQVLGQPVGDRRARVGGERLRARRAGAGRCAGGARSSARRPSAAT
jgi:hypothetical protein